MRTGWWITAVTLGVAAAGAGWWFLAGGAPWPLLSRSPSGPAHAPAGGPPGAGFSASPLDPAAAGSGTAARRAPDAPLVTAAHSGDVEEIKRRLAAGDDPNVVSSDGRTPLLEAVAGGSLEAVTALLDVGAGLDPTAASTIAPLFLAALQGREDIARLLVDRGARVNGFNAGADARTPLIVAAERGHLALVQLLLQAGAYVTAADGAGRTALHRAAEQGHVEIVQRLIEQGAPLEATDRSGATPLARARAAGHEKVIALLAERGAQGATDAERGLERDMTVEPAVREQDSGIAAASEQRSSWSRSWDGPVLPGYANAALLASECAAGDESADRREESAFAPGWPAIQPDQAAGFTKGEAVLALHRDGTASRAQLGELRCVAGECRGDWVISRLGGLARGEEVVAVAPLGFVSDASRLVVPRGSSKTPIEGCSPFPAPRLRRPVEAGCDVYDLGGSERLQVYWFANGSLADWGARWSFARPLREGTPAAWQYVGRAFGRAFAPRIAVRGDGPTRVLWTKCEGIGGPCRLTVVVTRVTANSLEVGRAFSAGGQPCD